MTYVLYGALGVLVVLGLLVAGAAIGWKARGAWQDHAKRVVAEEATEEERRQLIESQRAFEGMLNYNAEQAYGMSKSLEELAGGDA